MKRKLIVLMAVLMAAVSARAQVFEVDGVAYNVLSAENETLEVTSRQNGNRYGADDRTGGYIEYYEIPETVTYGGTTFTVTRIGDYAFNNSYGMVTLKLPNSVTEIGERAISNTYTLKTIELGTGVVTLGKKAFYLNDNLTSVNLPSGLTTIGEEAFYECSSLPSIEIPSTVTTV